MKTSNIRAGISVAGAPSGLGPKVVCSCGAPLSFPLGSYGQTLEACSNTACGFSTPHPPTGLGQRTSGHDHPRPFRKNARRKNDGQ